MLLHRESLCIGNWHVKASLPTGPTHKGPPCILAVKRFIGLRGNGRYRNLASQLLLVTYSAFSYGAEKPSRCFPPLMTCSRSRARVGSTLASLCLLGLAAHLCPADFQLFARDTGTMPQTSRYVLDVPRATCTSSCRTDISDPGTLDE